MSEHGVNNLGLNMDDELKRTEQKRLELEKQLDELLTQVRGPSQESWHRDFAVRLDQAKKRWPNKKFLDAPGLMHMARLFYVLGREDQASGGVHPDRSLLNR